MNSDNTGRIIVVLKVAPMFTVHIGCVGNMVQYQVSSEDELHPSQSVAPPTELRVERVLQRGLVISWTLPNITTLGDSNGLKIQGYQIFIDDVLNSTVLGCYQSKVPKESTLLFCYE